MNKYLTVVFGILSAAILAVVPGTVSAAGTSAQAAPPNPDEVIRLHSLSSAKLREIMKKIHHWRENNTAADLKQPGMDPELLDELVTQVEELLYHAELMSMGLPFTDLNETEMLIFKALGGELYTEALHIQQLVNNRQIDQLDRAFAQLDRTCQACHQMFRRDRED